MLIVLVDVYIVVESAIPVAVGGFCDNGILVGIVYMCCYEIQLSTTSLLKRDRSSNLLNSNRVCHPLSHTATQPYAASNG